jgi:hypothetical protein
VLGLRAPVLVSVPRLGFLGRCWFDIMPNCPPEMSCQVTFPQTGCDSFRLFYVGLSVLQSITS